MPRNDTRLPEVEIPVRVDVGSDRENELAPEFDGGPTLAENDSEPQFRRAERRVSVRKSALPKKTASRLRIASVAALVLCCAGASYAAAYRYTSRNWRFTLDSSDNIALAGNEKVT